MTAPVFGPSASWEILQQRSAVMRAVRTFFESRGFLEVETPLLSRDVVVEAHIDPFVVSEGDGTAPRYLQTSPEGAMKRLLAAGAPAIYQITRAFRAGERGKYHNPEFTLLEWYRTGDGQDAAIGLLDDLIHAVLDTPSARRIEYRALFRDVLEIDPWTVTAGQLLELCRSHELAFQHPEKLPKDDLLDGLLAAAIIPRLPSDRPVVVWGYPASQAALAALDPDEPRRAQRFELFHQGLELANGYVELLDPDAWIARARKANAERQAAGKAPLPVETGMLAAMQAGLPPCAGVALGLDRLVMLATGAASIDDVLAFPWEIA